MAGPSGEPAGWAWSEAVHPDDRAEVSRSWAEAVAAGKAWCWEFRLLRPDGQTCWVNCLVSPRVDSLGEIAGYVATFADITRRKQSEAQLEEAHKELVLSSRLAGMAEVATSVLHNVAKPVNDFAQQDEINVAVDEAHSRRAGGLGGAGETDAGVVAGPFRFERHVGLETREMREQVAQRDVAFASLELGDVVGDLVVQPELALLEELHQRRRGGNDFREGGAVEDGIESHGLRLRNQRPLPVGLAVDDLAVVPDHQNGAGQAVLCDGLVDRFIQRRRAGEGLCGERSGSQRGAPRELHMN